MKERSGGSARICHITSVHPRKDARILYKEAVSCKSLGEVELWVFDGEGNESCKGIQIVDLGRMSRRLLLRAPLSTLRLVKKLLRDRPEVLHFHDPELIPIGLFAALIRVRVIYDVHEDYPVQFMEKQKIPRAVRGSVARAVRALEAVSARYAFAAVTVASDWLFDRFATYTKSVYRLFNYPIAAEFDGCGWSHGVAENRILFVGSITSQRGITEFIEALALMRDDVIFDLAGPLAGPYRQKLEQMPGWKKVNYHGVVGREQYRDLCAKSKIGIVMDHPLPHYLNAYAVKMFEYMAAGLPVLISDFPMWQKFLDRNRCGLAVNPFDPRAVARAVEVLLSDRNQALEMSQNGRAAVANDYSWESQARNLARLYGDELKIR